MYAVGVFEKNNLGLIHSLWHAILSVSAMSCGPQRLHFHRRPHLHWRNSTKQSTLACSQNFATRCCLRRGLLAPKCDEHHRIQTFKSGQLNKGSGTYSEWWDAYSYGGGIFTPSVAELSSSEFPSSLSEHSCYRNISLVSKRCRALFLFAFCMLKEVGLETC